MQLQGSVVIQRVSHHGERFLSALEPNSDTQGAIWMRGLTDLQLPTCDTVEDPGRAAELDTIRV